MLSAGESAKFIPVSLEQAKALVLTGIQAAEEKRCDGVRAGFEEARHDGCGYMLGVLKTELRQCNQLGSILTLDTDKVRCAIEKALAHNDTVDGWKGHFTRAEIEAAAKEAAANYQYAECERARAIEVPGRRGCRLE